MNRIRALFIDDNTDISSKRYIVFSAATIVAVFGLFLVNVLTSSSPDVTVITWVLLFTQSISLVYSIYKRSFYFPSIVSCVLINFVSLPFVLVNGHLFFGAVPIWMVVGYAYTSLVLSKRTRTVVIILQSIINILCFMLSFLRDWNLVLADYPISTRFIDYWFAVISGGVIIFAMSTFSRWLYTVEQKTIGKQSEDIATLYQSQNSFFSSMSHEVRTPINTIIGLNEANLSMDSAEDIYDYSTEIKHAGKKLLTLINDILDLSKLQSGKMEVVNADYNLSDMISLITDDVWKKSYDKGIKLNINVDSNIPDRLCGDEIRIRQIVRNLLSNSINTTEAGYVKLGIRFRQILDDEINLIFEIEDTGVGVRRDELPYIFDAFRYNEDEKGDRAGTGLELSIAKSLSDIMDGELSIDSIYKIGSTYRFSVSQKVVSGKSGEDGDVTYKSPIKRRDYSSLRAKSARVLVVDDDGMNLNVFKKMFEGLFLCIDTATSGEEAIELVKNNEFDLIFIDHQMPGMDGLATLDRMKRIRKDIIAIALTANFGSDARALYKETGFTDYLSKPIDKEYALRTIFKLLPEDMINTTGEDDSEYYSYEKEYVETKKIPLIITTESVADIPESMLAGYTIPIIPFYVSTSEGKRYRDREEISSESLISFINNNDGYAFSEPPGESEYEIFFGGVLKQADRIIHISTAKNSSLAHANAVAASKSFSNVEVIDSGHVSFGLGVMVMDAAKLAAAGADASEIKEMILTAKEKTVFSFVVDETGNLAATGRIPLVIHRFCSFFNIHPVITLRNSKLTVRTVKIGNINKIRDRYYKKISKGKDIAKDFMAVLHSDFDARTIDRLQNELTESIPLDRYMTVIVGPATASNSGRGAFGISYRKK